MKSDNNPNDKIVSITPSGLFVNSNKLVNIKVERKCLTVVDNSDTTMAMQNTSTELSLPINAMILKVHKFQENLDYNTISFMVGTQLYEPHIPCGNHSDIEKEYITMKNYYEISRVPKATEKFSYTGLCNGQQIDNEYCFHPQTGGPLMIFSFERYLVQNLATSECNISVIIRGEGIYKMPWFNRTASSHLNSINFFDRLGDEVLFKSPQALLTSNKVTLVVDAKHLNHLKHTLNADYILDQYQEAFEKLEMLIKRPYPNRYHEWSRESDGNDTSTPTSYLVTYDVQTPIESIVKRSSKDRYHVVKNGESNIVISVPDDMNFNIINHRDNASTFRQFSDVIVRAVFATHGENDILKKVPVWVANNLELWTFFAHLSGVFGKNLSKNPYLKTLTIVDDPKKRAEFRKDQEEGFGAWWVAPLDVKMAFMVDICLMATNGHDLNMQLQSNFKDDSGRSRHTRTVSRKRMSRLDMRNKGRIKDIDPDRAALCMIELFKGALDLYSSPSNDVDDPRVIFGAMIHGCLRVLFKKSQDERETTIELFKAMKYWNFTTDT